MTVVVRSLTGDERQAALPALARLRIAVFRAFPYLYDGDLAYEEEYIREFAADPASVIITAYAGDEIVGAATASPMAAQKADFRQPLERAALAPQDLFYFGESVLLPDHRGQGIGHRFFDLREQAARDRGAAGATFAAVVRADDHPARPADYRPLDPFWRARGYAPVPGLTTRFDWKDVGDAAETVKPMQFWLRRW